MMKPGRKSPRGPARRATSASATRGRASCRRSGATATATSRRTSPSTTRIPRARTGATGRSCAATARCRRPTATTASSAASTTGSTSPATAPARKRSSPPAARAAVVRVQDEVRGRVPEVSVALKPGVPRSQAVIDRVIKANEEVIGKIARPKHVYIVPDMPKTRSGKIMRRVLAAISNRRDVGDVTTLANPDVVEQIRVMVQGKDTQATQEALPEDIAKFGQVE